ncbi:MAG: glycosyltransferase [Bacteroidales bacterium]|nr:glycosyltransferase [Bacteroidales bacterium]
MKKDLTIIIPFLNESENLPILVRELNVFLSDKSLNAEVIFVDDGSVDDSTDVLKKQEFKSFEVKLIKLSRNFGSHAALRAGIKNATGDKICFIYADLQDPLNVIEKMYVEMVNSFDIVWGHRNSTAYGFFEGLFSGIYNSLMKRFVHSGFPKTGFDIVMFNQKVKRELDDNIENNSSIFIQILLMGFKQSSISYDKVKRERGKSKWTLGKKIKLFVDSFVAFSFAPIRFVTTIGILFFVFGIIYALFIVFYQIFVGGLMLGWPTLIFVIMIGFGTTNISLGIIAEYLWRTLDASRKRKVFIIDEIIDLKKESK